MATQVILICFVIASAQNMTNITSSFHSQWRNRYLLTFEVCMYGLHATWMDGCVNWQKSSGCQPGAGACVEQ